MPVSAPRTDGLAMTNLACLSSSWVRTVWTFVSKGISRPGTGDLSGLYSLFDLRVVPSVLLEGVQTGLRAVGLDVILYSLDGNAAVSGGRQPADTEV